MSTYLRTSFLNEETYVMSNNQNGANGSGSGDRAGYTAFGFDGEMLSRLGEHYIRAAQE
jgi:hypothetical protein